MAIAEVHQVVGYLLSGNRRSPENRVTTPNETEGSNLY